MAKNMNELFFALLSRKLKSKGGRKSAQMCINFVLKD